jgi:pyruvate/2-oxoglutarate dehydrogenase complex dihydrolipoamide acyltransferase (E2) component
MHSSPQRERPLLAFALQRMSFSGAQTSCCAAASATSTSAAAARSPPLSPLLEIGKGIVTPRAKSSLARSLRVPLAQGAASGEGGGVPHVDAAALARVEDEAEAAASAAAVAPLVGGVSADPLSVAHVDEEGIEHDTISALLATTIAAGHAQGDVARDLSIKTLPPA